ncbi:CDP-alcohol phosphatidyltransferase family protein [Puniceibacterium sp. IMCC21224]|uniref:CDP-alcohol phosphatidyltransferase family protein n=1 Tax=Puniceibacterium sp. IMCC21224 TaxID=1618204 RepID=UPI00064DADAC|nr:CDP-alcohol phosphatidyltransferase family protein [Puniceibacterium sp. IMCC21224]KMK63776.1 CDP-alcohol phosphatidyltransferase [Puniceibacterium sp. IMCC21224]KMK63810.1 CDP-alcohol phosphatidyltransferase [Puniceibacterium sp. IMCC21224]
MTDKITRLWTTKTKEDEWWSSFVTAPLGIFANYWAVDIPAITPNRLTAASFAVAVAATLCILIGGFGWFMAAAILIHLSHILDCMDGQMARYRKVSSPVGSYFDRLTDQVQITLWFGAAGYAAYAQSLSVVPVFLALIGIAFYGLRGYVKYIALQIETALDPEYPARMVHLKRQEPVAGLGFGVVANVKWLLKEQPKILAFDEGVFIFMLSAALIFDQLTPMLWIFAASQVIWGTLKSWQRGKNIDANQKSIIQK